MTYDKLDHTNHFKDHDVHWTDYKGYSICTMQYIEDDYFHSHMRFQYYLFKNHKKIHTWDGFREAEQAIKAAKEYINEL